MDIYGTLGPASRDRNILEALFRAGMTGVRINMAHVSLRDSKADIENIREAGAAAGIDPEILIDLTGPELRIGKLENPLLLNEGDHIFLVRDLEGPKASAPEETVSSEHMKEAGMSGAIPIPGILMDHLSEGVEIHLSDGHIRLTVVSFAQDMAAAKVTCGGHLTSSKSIALEGEAADGIALPAVTAKDKEHISLAAGYGVTGIMQPFVRGAADIVSLRGAMDELGAGKLRIYAKIENRSGVEKLHEIIGHADEIVIARGDLGNAVPLYTLPRIQKEISACCRMFGRPFLVATEMLASMKENPVPTRAEVNDIFGAVLDGASSLMLTDETAVGKYPEESVRYLVRTAREAEDFIKARHLP